MTPATINLEPLWIQRFQEPVYDACIANLIGDETPEVMGVSYDHTLRAFDLNGNLVFKTEFPPEITQFISAPITSANSIELISGGTDGIVRLMTKKGKFIWTVNVGGPILSMDIGDVTGDKKNEIILGLENQKIVLIDHRGQILHESKSNEPILDTTLGFLPNDTNNTMLVLVKSGNVYSVDFADHWNLLFQIDGDPTCFTYTNYNDVKGFLVGFQNGRIRMLDLEGHLLMEYILGEKVSDIDQNFVSISTNRACYLVTAAGNQLSLFKLNIEKGVETAPALPKFPSESTPQSHLVPSSVGSKIFCPYCGSKMNPDFARHLSNNEDVYCEACGYLINNDVLQRIKK